MEAEDVIRDPLRIGRGMEDLALVLLENVEPAANVACMIGNIGRQSDLGADEQARKFGSEFFARVC